MSTSRCNSGQCTVDLLDIPSTGENDKRTVKQTSSSSLCVRLVISLIRQIIIISADWVELQRASLMRVR